MKVYYLAGPYSHWFPPVRAWRIFHAWWWAAKLWNRGFTVICPHLNTAFFEYATHLTWGDYLERDLEIIRRCDGLILMRGWEKSRGARREKGFAEMIGIPIFYANLL